MYKKMMIVFFAVILLGLSIGTLIAMPKEQYPFSENENRYLASFPNISLNSLTDKEFMEGFDKWDSDMFIWREKWINIKNNSERVMGKMNISGVYTYGGRMMQSWERNIEKTAKNLDAIDMFSKRYPGLTMYFLLAPTSLEIYNDLLPAAANFDVDDMRKYISYCENYLTGVTPINVTDILYQNRDKYIFYRTDHHWTSLGANLAYLESGRVMGFSPYSIDDFTVERAADDFRGTLYSKTLDSAVEPDIIDYYILSGGDPETTISVLGEEGYQSRSSIYFREYLDKKDKYSSFLGQNTPLLKIKSKLRNDMGKLLVFKDSYAHSLIPFLAKNWGEITVVDMRYINVDYNQYINPEEYDSVMFIYNAVTFSEDTHIGKLKLGIG
ncbi:MAG: hypothetical protein LBR74_06295 [Eubacterium sp.]|jgi:hypothetical protein|nr:hypothetical protein [Eubacterium sp.]